jgi:SAM-dependent methyltransferase
LPIINLKDFFKYGGNYLFPEQPCSLYRYMEYLIEICLARKHKLENILEIGPGTESIFKYLKPDEYKTGTVIDYNPEIVDFCAKHFTEKKITAVTLDMLDSLKVGNLNRKWDYVVCNSVLEHLQDDVVFVKNVYNLLENDGIIICSTVLHQGLYNKWDHAVGHYRRYSPGGLRSLFADFKEVQLVQSSLLQELVRPFFFSRIEHLLSNTIEENNRLVGEGYLKWGVPPYVKYFILFRFLMPVYLLIDWAQHSFMGGIGFIIARK